MALSFPADELVLELHKREKRQTSEAGVAHEDSGADVAIPKVRPRPTWLAVHRVDLSVYYRRIAREEFQTLIAIRDGRTLGDALEAGFAGSRIPQRQRPQRVQEWFASWAELEWICAS